MGLDQYLFAGPPPAQDEGRPTELAYWRKANHVHRWITEHVGEVKNVEPLPITREQLCALREAAITAIDREAKSGAAAPKHDYSLKDYGLTEDQVRTAFDR